MNAKHPIRMSKIRVVHILHSFGTGGMEKGVATIIRHAADNFEHVVLCLSASGETARLLPHDTHVVELHKRPGNSPPFLLKLARVLRDLKPDIVHTRNWGGVDGILAARLANNRRIVHGEHGWDMGDPDGRNPKRVMLRRLVSPLVREYTCVSRHMRKWLLDEVRVKKSVTQIYNGIDTEVFSPDNDRFGIRRRMGIPERTFVIGTVSRLDPIKDHPTLFKAFKGLKKSTPGLRLLVIGDGPERKRLERLSTDGIHFLGQRSDTAELLRCLDLFVLPSLNEGISNTILEAMASGLPVVATKVGGNLELVQDGVNGILVDPGDTQGVASAIFSYVKDDRQRHSHGTSGCSMARQHFSVEAMVKSYEKVYERVANA